MIQDIGTRKLGGNWRDGSRKLAKVGITDLGNNNCSARTLAHFSLGKARADGRRLAGMWWMSIPK